MPKSRAKRPSRAGRRRSPEPVRPDYAEIILRMQEGCGYHEVICDSHGQPIDYRFLAVNAAFARLTGLDPAAVTGKTVREVLPDLEASWIERLGRVALTGVPTHFAQHSAPLGRDYEVTAFSPELGRFVVVFDDVTERRRLMDQLRQAQKMEAVGQLAGGIAHDFRNILTIILALADSIQETLPAADAAMHAEMKELMAAAQRGTEITQKLLGFSRMEQLTLRRVDVRSVVEQVAGILRRVLPVSVEVEVRVAAGVAVHADANALHHILVNLANNARDAMPEGGRLTISCDAESVRRPEGDYICLRVRDSGIGMNQETADRIFDPFFTTKPAGEGTGLGMAMVYGLLREQRGTIEVDTAPGRGTEMRLFLPPDTSPPQAVRSAEREALPRGSETILIAEDEAALCLAAKRALERLGYRVLTAGDGDEALQLFYTHEAEIDLVISDSVMPKLGGAEVYEALANHEPPIRFLLSSGYSPTSAGHPYRPTAQVPFLQKPWTLGELARKVREVLDA